MDRGFYEARPPAGPAPRRVTAVVLAAIPSTPVYALMTFGVVLAVMGHVFRDQRIVGIGIAILFLATALLLLGAYQAYDDHGPVS
ncbi:hypothetical protein FSW04_22970 [Baekduia soli]|uniref:Uncharacterized protein n=1 Tax=Baekduia soli TaxID=496014 RepID=A0A5B8UAY2_9ACTN|nr:hypothetical protein [Baekduia soli]QEC50154.1 hypothetical protein FSW04_22970 [Baekduia soli]